MNGETPQNDTTTWNMNTWLSDNMDYSEKGNNYYSQLTSYQPKQFVPDDGKFKYAFRWTVDLKTLEEQGDLLLRRRGAVYVDPVCARPRGPSVDRPVARLVVEQPEGLPYESVVVEVADIQIVPDKNSKVFNYPQMYDQASEDLSQVLLDGLVTFDGHEQVTSYNYNCDVSADSFADILSGLPLWLILTLVIGGILLLILLIVIIVVLVLRYRKNHKQLS